jgi:hypothetical protein
MMNTPEYRDIERRIGQELQKTPLAITPNPVEVQQIDQELPEAWTQEYTPEELNQLLKAELDTPEGDIDQNAQNALNELYQQGALNHEEIMQEVRDTPELIHERKFERDQEVDVDR